MSITSVDKDFDTLTITLTAEFDAPVERVWQLWADPRQLERWWGPPTYPATFEAFDFTPGGSAAYKMTGPEGDTHRGWWRFNAVNPPSSLEFADGFAHDDGTPNDELPSMTVRVQLSERQGGGTRMEVRSSFASREQMEQIIAMGAVEGMQEAFGQMDALLVAA